MTDLFAKEKTKKAQLLDYLRAKKWCRTSEVILWGTRNFCNRAERNARQLAEEGKIKRMSDEDKKFYFAGAKEDVWVAV